MGTTSTEAVLAGGLRSRQCELVRPLLNTAWRYLLTLNIGTTCSPTARLAGRQNRVHMPTKGEYRDVYSGALHKYGRPGRTQMSVTVEKPIHVTLCNIQHQQSVSTTPTFVVLL